MLEKAREVTRDRYTHVEYARYADDLVVLVDRYERHAWLVPAVVKRLREELCKLGVEVNEEKTRVVDLTKDEAFSFLGFEFRRVRSLRGVWRPQYTPRMKKRTALLRKLAHILRKMRSQPIGTVIARINPILRGWVQYFAVGNAGRCFNYVRTWVERKVRRHMMRARKRKGFGWKRWSTRWLHDRLGLFEGYRVMPPERKALPVR